MKQGLHPTWYSDCTVVCACGNTWVTGATVQEIRTDICSKCHPFYTGEQRIVDTEGRVDVFMRRLQQRNDMIAQEQARVDAAKPNTNLALSELGLSKRYMNVLEENDLVTVGDFLEKLETIGEDGILELKGIGRGALTSIKKALREAKFELPKAEAAE